MPEQPQIESALDGDPIPVQPNTVGHHLLGADHDDGYGATFSFYWTESGSWESETSLYARSVRSKGADAAGWDHVLSAGSDGESWDWDRLEDSESWTHPALLVMGLTGREDVLDDGREVSIGAVYGFAAPAVARLLCKADGSTHDVAINEPWRSFIAVGVTTDGRISLVAYDADGAVLEHTTYNV